MTTSYRNLDLDSLMTVRLQYRTNLAALELQAAKFGPLYTTTPLGNELADTRRTLTDIDAEVKRRAGGILPDPPDLVEIREKIALFTQAIHDTREQGEADTAHYLETRLATLRDQETTLIHQRDDYAGAVREQAQTVATDLERSNQVYHAALARQRGQRERFVNKSSLTLDLTMFRDRVQERSQILTLLANPAVRVVQIVGQGGMGKTALASYALLTIEQNGFALLAGGSAFHALIFRSTHAQGGLKFEQLISDIARVCPDVAEPLSTLAQSGDYPAQATALLEIAGEIPLLLVLDNCETLMDADGHILDAGMAALLEAVLRPNHAWRILLTSRRALAVLPDQRRYLHQVVLREGLPTADAMAFLHDLDPDETMALRRTPDDVLAHIIQRLDGRPRLLEQFIGLLNISTYTPVQLLERPEVLDTLTHTLQDWLTAGERAIVQALAVFGAPIPRDALEYLMLPDYPILALDATLARLSTGGVISQSEGVFSLHPLDAEVALGRATATRTLHQRAADYYQQRELPPDQWRTIDDLAPQISRAEHLTAAGLCDAAAEVLAAIDFDYLYLWGHSARIISLREPLVGRLTHARFQMSNDNNLGLCYAAVGRTREAAAYYEQGLHRALQHHNKGWQGKFLGNLGNTYAALGEVRRAIDLYEQALVIAREIGDRQDESKSLGSLGSAYVDLGEVRRAIDFYEQSLMISREIGDQRGEGTVLGHLGSAYAALGEVRQAIDYHEQSLVISREIGGRLGEGVDLGNLGNAYVALGDVRRAIDLYAQALVIFREIGHRRGEGAALGNLGNRYAALGDVQCAIDLHEQALMISREIGDRYSEAIDLGSLGSAYAELGEMRRAIDLYEQTLVIAREIGDRRSEGSALWGLGVVCADVGEVRRAINLYEQQLVIVREIGDRRGEGAALGNLGEVYATLGEVDRAIDYHEQALVIRREIGNRYGEAIGLENMAVCYAWLGDFKQAEDLLATVYTISNEIDLPERISSVLVEQGHLLRTQTSFREANERYTTALGLDQPQTAGWAAWGCGLVAVLQGEPAQAQAHWEDTARRCAEMHEVLEYRYLAGAVDLALAALTTQPAQAETGLSALRTVLSEAPLPYRAAEILRDLHDVARALGETPILAEAIALLKPIAAQMQIS